LDVGVRKNPEKHGTFHQKGGAMDLGVRREAEQHPAMDVGVRRQI
jgi:hypothetical protein